MKKRGKRIGAWLMALVMVWGLVMVPAGKAEAAEVVTVNGSSVITETDTGVYLSYTSTLEFAQGVWGSTPEVDIYKYEFTLHNNTSEKISDWSVKITPNSNAYYNSSWNGAVYDSTTGSIVIGTYKGIGDEGEEWTNVEIEAGGTATGAGLQCRANIFEGATIELTYYVGDSTKDPSVDDTLTDPSAIGKTDAKVTANVTQSDHNGEYYQYTVSVSNGLSETISDWVVVVPATGITSSTNWDGDWAKVKWSYTNEYLYITSKSGETISAGQTLSGDSYKIQYNGSSALSTSEAIVYYKTGSSSTGAFDNVLESGTQPSGGSSSSGGGGSSGGGTFDGNDIGTIDSTVGYNFAKALQYSLYFYDANMCGDEVNETSLYSKEKYEGWRGNCHVNDKFTYNGKEYSAVGGFHDAGDHVKFGLPMAQAMSSLGMGYMEFGQAYDELGQTQHLKTIVDYYCDYVKRCTVLNSDGEVEAFCYQVGNGQADHEQWKAPEVEDETATKRYFTLVATASNPAADIVSETAAALAINYINFGNAQDLEYAKKLFAFAKKYPNTIGAKDGGFYSSSSADDDYSFAAAMLYKATGDASYKSEYNVSDVQPKAGNIYSWDEVYQAAALYAPDNNTDLLNKVNGGLATIANSSKDSYYCYSDWGSARYNCNAQFMMMIYDKRMNGKTAYPDWAKYQMSIILGNNSQKKNLVVGYNESSPKQPHHRAASGQSGWGQFHDASVVSKYTLFGALVGGPTSSDFSSYVDKMDDDHTSEVTLDYNASFAGALAALYLKNKNSTEEGFTDQTISTTFYGGSEFAGGTIDTPVSVEAVAVSPVTTTLTIGDTEKLTVTFTPANATNKNITWTSSDSTVATVDTKGIVTAVKAGTTTIKATTEDGGFTANCAVTVKKKTPVIDGSGNIEVVVGTQLKDVSTAGYTAKVGTATVAGTFSWKEADKTLSMADTTFTLVFTPTDGNSYNTAEKNITFTMKKKENTNKPAAPSLQSKTDSSVILEAYSGTEAVEYGILSGDDYSWQNENTFTGLDAYASYTFAMRFAETTDTLAGQAGESLMVKTHFAEADTYKVDLGRLSENGYVEAHNGTITYDEGTKTLTLVNAEKSYTITGENAEITVVMKNSDTILSDTTLKKIESEEDVTLELVGDNKVTEGIVSSGSVTIRNGSETSQAGSLEVSSGTDGAIVSDKIFIESGEVTATGSGEAPALKGTTEIDLLGGTLTANADTTPVIQVDTTQEGAKIVLDGCQVNPAADPEDIYNVDPVDRDGNAVESCQVVYKNEEAGTEQKVSVKKGSEVTLPNLAVREGYKALGWCIEGTSDVLEQGAKITVNETVTYVAEYLPIEGGLEIEVADAKALIAGYLEDEGVNVTIKNNSDISLEKVDLTLSNDDFTLSQTSITNFAAGDSQEVQVKLKRGKAANTEGYEVTVTASSASKEVAAVSKTISRVVNAAEKQVTGITVTLDSYTIKAGSVTRATASIVPEDATNKAVKWSSSNTAVATVDSEGIVKAIAEGTVTITATAQDDSGVIGTNELTVTKAEETENPEEPTDKNVTKITVALEENTIKAGTATKATATVTPEDATNKAVTWSTGNEKIATVTQDGTVTAVAEGVVDIIASAQDGSGITGKAVLTVTKNPTQTSDTGNENTGNKGNGNSQPATTEAPQSAGSADEVKATGIQVTADVKKVENILASGTMKLAPKKKMQLNVSFQPEDAEEEELTFTSSNPKAATVDEDGEITAGKKPGTTTITVRTENGLTKTFRIQVMKKAVTKVKLQAKTKTVKTGKTLKVKATLSPSKKLASNSIYWTTSNSKIATVTQKGVVKGIKKGKAKITATATDGSGKKATITIKVK